MKRLPPNKRNQLIGVIIATVGLICIVYFMLISPQNDTNQQVSAETSKASLKLQQYQTATTTKQMDATTAQLAEVTQRLARAEDDLASGDLYAWTVETIRRFKTSYHRVDIATTGQPNQTDCELIGAFPYKQIRFSLSGTAFYHDMGKFISDFENKYPHCRIVNLIANPAGGSEKLDFRMDIVALVKTNT